MNPQRPPSQGIPQPQPGQQPQGLPGHQITQMGGMNQIIRYQQVPGYQNNQSQMAHQMAQAHGGPPISIPSSTAFASGQTYRGVVPQHYNQMAPRAAPQSIINSAQVAQGRSNFVSAQAAMQNNPGGPPPHIRQPFQPGQQGPRQPSYQQGQPGQSPFPRFAQPMPSQQFGHAGFQPTYAPRPVFSNQQFNPSHQFMHRPPGPPHQQAPGVQQGPPPPQQPQMSAAPTQQPGQPNVNPASPMNPDASAWNPAANRPQFHPQPFEMPQQQQQQQQLPKTKRSYAIQIKDPETGLEIDPKSDDKPGTRSHTASESKDTPDETNEMVTKSKSKGKGGANVKKKKTKNAPKSQKPQKEVNTPPSQERDGGGVLAELSQNGEINGNTLEQEEKKQVVENKQPEVTVVAEQQQPQTEEKDEAPVVDTENQETPPPPQQNDDDGWVVTKTKKGKGNKKQNEKVEKSAPKKNEKPQPKEKEPKKKEEVKPAPEEAKEEETPAVEPVAAPAVAEEAAPVPAVEPAKVVESVEVAKEEEKPAEVKEEKEEPKVEATEEKKEEKEDEKEEEKKEEEKVEEKPAPVKEFESLALENRAKLEQGGKVSYGRDFLLKFQSACLMKPTELPELEVILSQPTEAHRRAPNHERENKNNFIPPFVRPHGKGGRGPHGAGHSKDHRRPSKPHNNKIIKLPSREPVKLHEQKDENKFKTFKDIKKDMTKEDTGKEEFKRQAKAILNKLSPDNEDRLTKAFTELVPNSYELLNIVVSTVFDKAIQEPGFSTLYARLCKKCHETWSDKYVYKVKAKDGASKQKAFREVLLTKAQEKFEKLKFLHVRDRKHFDEKSYEYKRIEMEEEIAAMPKEGEEGYDKRKAMELAEELADVNVRIKQMSMGNVTFVGQLYLHQLLSLNIMSACMRQLVTSDNENELESLSKLIPTIGEAIENECRPKRDRPNDAQQQKKAEAMKKNFDDIFQKIQSIIERKVTLKEKAPVSPRIVCLLQDICDMKARGWRKRGTSGPGLMKKSELEKHHQQQQIKDKRLTEEMHRDNQERRSKENMHRQQRFKSGEWTQSTGITRPKFDPTSLAGRGPTRGASQGTSSGEPVTLGPRRKGPRQNVTRLGSTDSNQGSNSSRGATPTSSNMFDLLTENDDMDTAQQMTKSSSFNRRPSETPAQRPPKLGGHGRAVTHDGRTTVKKLNPEEVNQIKDEATKKSRIIFNDFEEADGDVAKMEELCRDVEKYGLLESEDHQCMLIDHLITSVIDKKEDKARFKMAKFFEIMADNVKRLHFQTPLRRYVEKCVDEDYMTDFPRYWECLSMVIAPLFKSRNISPTMASKIFLKAGDEDAGCMQLTKAYVALLKELSFLMSKADLHKFFAASEIDLLDAMDKDCIKEQFDGSVASRLREVRAYKGGDLSYLTEELVIIDWASIESGLVKMLNEHDFSTDAAGEDFSKEYDFLEGKVPNTQDGRGSLNFIKVIVNAVMAFSTERDGESVKMKKSGDDLALANCDLLLRKYTENDHAKMDTLFILSDLFRTYQNNPGVIKETFVTLYETEVIDESIFKKWMDIAQKQDNYAVIKAATTGFFTAMAEENSAPKE